MKSLLKFIYRFHYFILFILIECFSIFLLVQYNSYHQASFLNSSSNISGVIYQKTSNVSQYLNLKEKNIALNNALAKYKTTDLNAYQKNKISLLEIFDSVFIQKYNYIPCQVINNSVNKQNNYITLNAGVKQGINKKMAVISPIGIIGVVKDVSSNYASVISILNPNLKISAMLKRTGYFGSLSWDGVDYKTVQLYDLPNHISISKGDTVITSGYSAMFPKGELIGWVDEIEEVGGSEFIRVKVKLAVDFKNLSNVIVIKNLLREEQLNLEKAVSHD